MTKITKTDTPDVLHVARHSTELHRKGVEVCEKTVDNLFIVFNDLIDRQEADPQSCCPSCAIFSVLTHFMVNVITMGKDADTRGELAEGLHFAVNDALATAEKAEILRTGGGRA